MVVQGVSELLAGPPLGTVVFQALSIGLGYSCSRGYGPVAEPWCGRGAVEFFSSGHPSCWIMLAAMAPPGTGRARRVSIDARLFGWRRLEIRDRKVRTRLPDE